MLQRKQNRFHWPMRKALGVTGALLLVCAVRADADSGSLHDSGSRQAGLALKPTAPTPAVETELYTALRDSSRVKLTDITTKLAPFLPEPGRFARTPIAWESLKQHYEKQLRVLSAEYPAGTFQVDLARALESYSGDRLLGSSAIHRAAFIPIGPEEFNEREIKTQTLAVTVGNETVRGLRIELGLPYGIPPELAKQVLTYSQDFTYVPTVNARVLGYTHAQLILPLSDGVEPSPQFEYNGLHDWSEHGRYRQWDQINGPIRLTNVAHPAGSDEFNISSHPDFAVKISGPTARSALITFFLWREKLPLGRLGLVTFDKQKPDFILQLLFPAAAPLTSAASH